MFPLFNFQVTKDFRKEIFEPYVPLETFGLVVGTSGLEPPTSRLSGVRSNRLSYKPISWFERWFPTRPLVFPASAIAFRRTGGDERVRTDDPLLAKQVLSQLSYTPIFTCGRIPIHFLRIPFFKDPQN